MKFEEFKVLFCSELEVAANNGEQQLQKPLPRNYDILLYGGGFSGDIVDLETAMRGLFIDENLFYRVVDIAVQEVNNNRLLVFVRVSGHAPVAFSNTYNYANGTGPFKQLSAQINETI